VLPYNRRNKPKSKTTRMFRLVRHVAASGAKLADSAAPCSAKSFIFLESFKRESKSAIECMVDVGKL